ncbi:SPX domain-containing membrane protein At4g22990 isoform X3 [Physcomitrium patens]|uniref:SPX domain-containing protein n=1 Tax=Physcomitrium patens TaxID=3218 RepID=A0A7I4AJY0_PHYPA|nr:SPX domain-containing membrane protein Os06g0129400-like isoform X3 [Physcomitrium patens]|eukprot:XP_024391930.1 SPX domain-containing membrane protein Os06g0129400-like isoform X3 [Physcomitrella patens]
MRLIVTKEEQFVRVEMVHFGQYLRDRQILGWEEYYIAYKSLKKRIKQDSTRAQNSSIGAEERHEIVKTFSELLDCQVEKVVLFMIEKQGLLAERLQKLRKQREAAATADFLIESEVDEGSDLNERPSAPVVVHWQVMDEYRQIGTELLQLLNFVELNVTGLRKILKKFDKRVGVRLGGQYIASRSNHPYSQLQQVFRTIGIGAMVATISRNLAELRNESLEAASASSAVSLFRYAALPARIIEEEPVIQAIEETMQRLTHEVNIQTYLSKELLLPAPSRRQQEAEAGRIPGLVQEEAHFMSIQINLFNTFLYMVNYYIIVPSSDDYAKLLDAPGTLCGVIIGSMPLAALVSALVYSWWSNFSYKAPLIVSSFILMAGNFLYAIALHFDSVWLLLIGRFLCGLGGARAINRRYICDHVPLKQLTSASAAFISASALGMAVGPALAGLLSRINFKIYGTLPVNFVTAPGWLLFLSWSLYLIIVLFFFKEPDRATALCRRMSSHANLNTMDSIVSTDESTLVAPLLSGSINVANGLQGYPSDEEESRESTTEGDSDYGEDKAVETVSDLMKELTRPVKILLWVYFMLKFASELLISESSLLTDYYFNWKTSQVAIFLSLLGLTVLPMSAVVGNCISNIYEDRVVVLWSQVTTGVGVAAILCYSPWVHYSAYQYVTAAVVIFVSTNVLEGVNMSLLSKVMSPRMSRGVFNCGLLSTEAGTLARAIADGLISVAGKCGIQNLVNLTMLPTLAIVAATTGYTCIGYFTLY